MDKRSNNKKFRYAKYRNLYEEKKSTGEARSCLSDFAKEFRCSIIDVMPIDDDIHENLLRDIILTV